MTIRDLSIDERTVQLIEECGECIQAAAKLIRAMHGWSTPVKPIEAREHLIEEIADVSVCMTALHTPRRGTALRCGRDHHREGQPMDGADQRPAERGREAQTYGKGI